jgi:hypothetical protein
MMVTDNSVTNPIDCNLANGLVQEGVRETFLGTKQVWEPSISMLVIYEGSL